MLNRDQIRNLITGSLVETTTETGVELSLDFGDSEAVQYALQESRFRALRGSGKWWIDGDLLCLHIPDLRIYGGERLCSSVDIKGDLIVRTEADGRPGRGAFWRLSRGGPKARTVIEQVAARLPPAAAAKPVRPVPAEPRSSAAARQSSLVVLGRDAVTKLISGSRIETFNDRGLPLSLTFRQDGLVDGVTQTMGLRSLVYDTGKWSVSDRGFLCLQVENDYIYDRQRICNAVDLRNNAILRYRTDGTAGQGELWKLTVPGPAANAVIADVASGRIVRAPIPTAAAPVVAAPVSIPPSAAPPRLQGPIVAARPSQATVPVAPSAQSQAPAASPAVAPAERERLLALEEEIRRMRQVMEGIARTARADAARSAAAQTEAAAVAKPPAVPPGIHFGKYHALVIGNNAYREFPPLKTAANDAAAVAALLRNVYGFDARILRDATRADILTAMADLREKLTPDDNLLVYYAGHGTLDSIAQQGYWLPVDAQRRIQTNWVSNDDVTTMLRAVRAKHIIVVADSCFSGTLVRSGGLAVNVQGARDVWIRRMVGMRARTALVSGGLEPVTDDGSKGHSVFANAFMTALRENGGVIEGSALFEMIKRPVVVNADQTPQYSDIRRAGHEGGDFLFVRRAAIGSTAR